MYDRQVEAKVAKLIDDVRKEYNDLLSKNYYIEYNGGSRYLPEDLTFLSTVIPSLEYCSINYISDIRGSIRYHTIDADRKIKAIMHDQKEDHDRG